MFFLAGNKDVYCQIQNIVPCFGTCKLVELAQIGVRKQQTDWEVRGLRKESQSAGVSVATPSGWGTHWDCLEYTNV